MLQDGIHISEDILIPFSELSFRTSRSGGPGGQNVNKIESRVELKFDVEHSPALSDEQRVKVLTHLRNKVDSKGILHLVSQSSRSQWENKEIVVAEFSRLLGAALKPVKKRIPTRPSKVVKEKRLKKKRILSEKKKLRRGSYSD